jgi:hypothetical protein
VRLKLIACEVLYRELCAVVARSPHQVDVSFLPKGLHDLGAAPMVQRLQAEVDAVEPDRYDGILLGYGLCGNGVAGLIARKIQMVLPRAHDCITLFLGDKRRYLDYFEKHPGVYFKTSGWIERGNGTDEISQDALRQQGFSLNHAEMVAKYGAENAEFLEQELLRYKTRYTQFTFIEMGLEPDDRFERCTIAEAAERGWRFEKVKGSMELFEGLVKGDWDPERYLLVPPGHRIVARYDEGIIGTEAVAE